jgi:type II secretory pathway component PulF
MSAVHFRWRAADAAGQVRDGVLSASDEREALNALRRDRLYPIAIEPVRAAVGTAARWGTSRHAAASSWLRTLATLVGGGVTLDRALQVAAREVPHHDVARAAGEVGERVRAGAALSDAIAAQRGVFAAPVVAMVRAGEAGGVLADALARAAEWSDERDVLRAELRAQLLYPAILGGAAVIGVGTMLVVVIPKFAGMLADLGGTPPWSTRVLLGVSALATQAGVWLVLALVIAAWWWRRWLQDDSNRLRWHAARLRLPVSGTWERDHGTAVWGRTVAALLRGGVSLLPAIRIAAAGESNAALREQLQRAVADVEQGRRLASSLEGALPALALQLIGAGEESGRLDDSCERVGAAYERTARRALRTLVGLVEPAVVLGFGVLVGFVALGMLQAIYSVNGMVMR